MYCPHSDLSSPPSFGPLLFHVIPPILVPSRVRRFIFRPAPHSRLFLPGEGCFSIVATPKGAAYIRGMNEKHEDSLSARYRSETNEATNGAPIAWASTSGMAIERASVLQRALFACKIAGVGVVALGAGLAAGTLPGLVQNSASLDDLRSNVALTADYAQYTATSIVNGTDIDPRAFVENRAQAESSSEVPAPSKDPKWSM